MHLWNPTKQQAYWDMSNFFSNMAVHDPNQYVYIQHNILVVVGLTSHHVNSSIGPIELESNEILIRAKVVVQILNKEKNTTWLKLAM